MKKTMSTTPRFASLEAAANHYISQDPDQDIELVRWKVSEKVMNGEIFIGAPLAADPTKIILIDGRYHATENQ